MRSASGIPDAHPVTVPGAGQMLPMEQPEQCIRLVQDFLGERPGNGETVRG